MTTSVIQKGTFMDRALVALGLAILGLRAQASTAPDEIAAFVTVQPETLANGDTVTITVKA